MLIIDAQKEVDKVYGEGEWEVLEYNGGHETCLLKHKCGKEKKVARFSTFKLGKTNCECQYKKKEDQKQLLKSYKKEYQN